MLAFPPISNDIVEWFILEAVRGLLHNVGLTLKFLLEKFINKMSQKLFNSYSFPSLSGETRSLNLPLGERNPGSKIFSLPRLEPGLLKLTRSDVFLRMILVSDLLSYSLQVVLK